MRPAILSAFFLVIVANINAQNYSGKYSVETTDGGTIFLILNTTDDIYYSGYLQRIDQSRFPIESQLTDQGSLEGYIVEEGISYGFLAVMNDKQINISIIPFDEYGETDLFNAQIFSMKREEAEPNDVLNNSSISPEWYGLYYGQIEGVAATMELNNDGKVLSGSIDVQNYTYDIRGSINGMKVKGKLKDQHGQIDFAGSMKDTKIVWTIIDNLSNQSYSIDFYREKENVGITQQNMVPISEGPKDPNLIGNWLYSESYTSGTFTMASQWRFIFKNDGSFLYGDAKMSGGDALASAQSTGGDYYKGTWKTEKDTIYLNEGQGWVPYAKYYIEGDRLLMTISDESKKIWFR